MGVRSKQAGGRSDLGILSLGLPMSFHRDTGGEEGSVPLLHCAAKTNGYSAPLKPEPLQPFDS